MMAETFYWILNMSIAGSLTGLIVMPLRKVKRLPHRYICVLWLLPFIRMAVPFGFPSKYSVLNLIAEFATKSVPVYSAPEYLPPLSYTNYIMAVNNYGESTPTDSLLGDQTTFIFKSEWLEKIFFIGSIIWMVVLTAGLLTFALLYFITKSELRTATCLHGNVYVSDKITSPALYGVVRPKIMIPRDFPKELLLYVEEHENAHRRRCDNLTRLAAITITCIHWFNPLAWIMLKMYLHDVELACDEAVLRKIGNKNKKAYASALVCCEESKLIFAPAFSASLGGAKIKVRIENIISFRKLTVGSAILFGILIAVLAVTLLTNAS